MATKRKRDRFGRFVKGATRKRKTTTRRKAAPRRKASAATTTTTTRRRSYRRNPRRPDLVKTLLAGTVTATQVLLGKAAVRTLPTVLKLPQGGNAGLAVQVATALGIGYVADMFFSKATAAAILAGGLTAPVETLLVGANIPYLSAALSPGGSAVAGYVPPFQGVQGYVPSSPAATGLGDMGSNAHYGGAYPGIFA